MHRPHETYRRIPLPGVAGLLTTLLIALGLGPTPSAADEPTHHQGIDVSHHDEGIQWPAVRAAGITFAYIKATEGIDFTDPLFQKHWQEAGKAGLVRGAYHFFRPLDDGATQARFFLSTVVAGTGLSGNGASENGASEKESRYHGELIPVVDVEVADGVDGATLLAELQEWLDLVEEATGTKPMIYTGVRFWNTLAGSEKTAAFASYPLWIAEYDVEGPTIPSSWKSWVLWQYTENATVDGLGIPVDKSRTQGPLEHLRSAPPEASSTPHETP